MTTNTIPVGPDLGSVHPGAVLPTDEIRWLAPIKRHLAALQRRRARRQAILALSRMSDAALLDIGIPRDRIPDAVDGLIAREGPDPRR